ncbi:MAG TPA: YlbF family regulator [Clostridia bacterium]|nr:YlbF family regulator [Clostridia bacterium]
MIELARELGLALANSCEFIQMKQAQSDFEQNEAIAQLMQELNEKRDRLISILSDDEGDDLEAVSLTNDIDRLEAQLRESPLYEELIAAQTAFSAVLTAVNDEINACIGAETSANQGCSGDCGGCGGCKH